MNEEQNPELRLPKDEDDVHDMAGAETEQEQAVAVAQARLIGDID